MSEAARPIVSVGFAAGLAVGLRLLASGESLSDRAMLLMLVAALGGAASVLPAAAAFSWSGLDRRPNIRMALGALSTTVFFIPATLALFAIKLRILDGRIEGDLASGFASGDIFFSLFGAMGMFTPTGLRYLAPWPLAAVALAAAFAFRRLPRAHPESR